jgi:hypothetical protein
MKSFILTIAIALMGSMALACPNLAGVYMCPSPDSPRVLVETTIEQYVVDGVTHYVFITEDDSFEWPADGKLSEFSYKDDASGSDITIGISLTCSILNQFIYNKEVDVIGNMYITSVSTNMTKLTNGDIARNQTINYNGQDFNFQDVCAKK